MINRIILWLYYVVKISNIEFKRIRMTKTYADFLYKNTDKKKDSINKLESDELVKTFLCKLVEEDLLSIKTKNKIINSKYSIETIVNIESELKNKNIEVLTFEDEEYPDILKEIYDPPYVLFYIGNISLLDEEMFAVVGSRKSSQYGINSCKYIVSELAKKFIIVSGLAKGIDYYAHKYAMFSSDYTIAIMGTAIDKIYPKSNYGLYKEILARGGLIISEHAPGFETRPYDFARRNRIIAGLSRGVLIVEAEEKSGALTTAQSALDENRNVYAVPGQIFSNLSKGTNNIIKEGAKLVENANDILEDYFDFLTNEKVISIKNDNKFNKNTSNMGNNCVNIMQDEQRDIQLTMNENLILNTLSSRGALSIDEINSLSDINISDILSSLNKLCIYDLIIELDGNRFAPINK